MGLRKVTWSNQGPAGPGRPASRRRGRGQTRQELPGPLESFCSEVLLGIHVAKASREHEVSRGPARLLDPATSQAALLAGFLPLGSCPHQPQLPLRLSPQSPPRRSASPPHAPPAVSLLPTPFFLTLVPDAQGQEWGWEERLRWQEHSGVCREGAWGGGAGTARRSRPVAPGPGCSSCGQPDGGRCHGRPCCEPRSVLCCLGQVTEPVWASVSPPVKQQLPHTGVMKIN